MFDGGRVGGAVHIYVVAPEQVLLPIEIKESLDVRNQDGKGQWKRGRTKTAHSGGEEGHMNSMLGPTKTDWCGPLPQPITRFRADATS